MAKVYPDRASLQAIGNINDGIVQVIGGCNSSAYWAVLNALWTLKEDHRPGDARQKFVFIIDVQTRQHEEAAAAIPSNPEKDEWQRNE